MISNIIPTHNRKNLLMAHLWALPRQTLSVNEWEVIVVCDSCTDGSHEAAEEWAKIAPYKLKVLSMALKNRSQTRNWGANFAQWGHNDILVFNDDDTIPETQCFEVFNNSVKPGIAGMGYTTENNHKRQGSRESKWTLFMTANISVHMKDFQSIGGFDAELGKKWGWEDHDLAYRLKQDGVRLRYFPKARSIILWNKDDEVKSLETNRDYLIGKYGSWPPKT